MLKKWKNRQQNTSSSAQQTIPEDKLPSHVVSNLFAAVNKLDVEQLQTFFDEYDAKVVVLQKQWGFSLLHAAVNRGDDELQSQDDILKTNKIINLLIDNGINVEEQDAKNGMKAIHLAAKRCSKSFTWIQSLVERGKQSATCLCSEKGFTPLHYAISFNRTQLVKQMLEYGTIDFGELQPTNCEWSVATNTQPSVGAKRGLFPIHLAAREGNCEMLELLTEHGTVVLNHNHELLHTLASLRKPHLVEHIDNPLALFVNIPTLDQQKQTPLQIAIIEGHVDCVKHLLKLGSDPTLLDSFGKTSIDYAKGCFSNRETVLQELVPFIPNNAESSLSNPLASLFQAAMGNPAPQELQNSNEDIESIPNTSQPEPEDTEDNIYYL